MPLYLISINSGNIKFWDQVCPKLYEWQNFEKNINIVISIQQCTPERNFSHFPELWKTNTSFLSQSFVSVRHTWDIFQSNFKKSLDLDVESLGLPHWARITFMIYWIWTQKIIKYLTGLGLTSLYIGGLDLKSIWINLWYILEMDLKTFGLTYWIRTDFLITKQRCC